MKSTNKFFDESSIVMIWQNATRTGSVLSTSLVLGVDKKVNCDSYPNVSEKPSSSSSSIVIAFDPKRLFEVKICQSNRRTQSHNGRKNAKEKKNGNRNRSHRVEISKLHGPNSHISLEFAPTRVCVCVCAFFALQTRENEKKLGD